MGLSNLASIIIILFGVLIIAKFLQVVTKNNLITVFFDHGLCGVIMGSGELHQDIFAVLLKDILDGVLPTFKQLTTRFGADVHVVGFIGNQDDFVFAKIFKGDGIFFEGGKVGMELLDGGKGNVDIIGVDGFKIADRSNINPAIINGDILIEQVFGG